MTATQFNMRYPVGSPVKFFPHGSEDFINTVTESEAWENESGGVVVMVDLFRRPVSVQNLIREDQNELN